MTGEPEKSLIFFWRDPPAEVTEPLSVIPLNALEPNGQNKLLLVGRWYETDIQFSVGTPVLNDDGTQQSWISEKVVYEGKSRSMSRCSSPSPFRRIRRGCACL